MSGAKSTTADEVAKIREVWAGSQRGQYTLSHAGVGTLLARITEQERQLEIARESFKNLRQDLADARSALAKVKP